MSKETKKLYRISSMFAGDIMGSPFSETVKYYPETPLQHYFFVCDRAAKSIITGEAVFHDYIQRCPVQGTSECKCTLNECLYTYAREAIHELFTEREAEKFSKYLNKKFDADLTVEQQQLPIDLREGCRMAFEYKDNGGYWHVHEQESYPLPFKVSAYSYYEDTLPEEIRLFTSNGTALYQVKENSEKLSPVDKLIFRDYRRKARKRNNRQFKIGKTTDWQELCDQLPTSYKF